MKFTVLIFPSFLASIFIFFFRRRRIHDWLIDVFWQHQDASILELAIPTIVCSLALGFLYIGIFGGLLMWSFVAFFESIKKSNGNGASGILIAPMAIIFSLIAAPICARLIIYITTKILKAIV